MRRELRIGLLLFALFSLLRCFTAVPHFILGALMGLSLCFELIGVLPERTVQALRAKKRALFRLP